MPPDSSPFGPLWCKVWMKVIFGRLLQRCGEIIAFWSSVTKVVFKPKNICPEYPPDSSTDKLAVGPLCSNVWMTEGGPSLFLQAFQCIRNLDFWKITTEIIWDHLIGIAWHSWVVFSNPKNICPKKSSCTSRTWSGVRTVTVYELG